MGIGSSGSSASPALYSRLLGIFASRSHDPMPILRSRSTHPNLITLSLPWPLPYQNWKTLLTEKFIPKMFEYSVILPEMPPADLILYSLPTVAVSLCTCVAVLTATIGFWRIRAVGFKSDASPPPTSPPLKPNPPVGPTDLMPPTTPVACHVEPAGSPKARFTVCYSADVDEVEEDEGEEDGGGDSYREVTGSWQLRGLESEGSLAINSRRGDLGWYRYQERTAINGSVVRLWG